MRTSSSATTTVRAADGSAAGGASVTPEGYRAVALRLTSRCDRLGRGTTPSARPAPGSTSARSTRRREHSTAAARALSNAFCWLPIAHPRMLTSKTVVNDSTFANLGPTDSLGYASCAAGPGSPTGRDDALKPHPVWVRIPLGAPSRRRCRWSARCSSHVLAGSSRRGSRPPGRGPHTVQCQSCDGTSVEPRSETGSPTRNARQHGLLTVRCAATHPSTTRPTRLCSGTTSVTGASSRMRGYYAFRVVVRREVPRDHRGHRPLPGCTVRPRRADPSRPSTRLPSWSRAPGNTGPCLFPQHGPGRKHERPIVLDTWQRAIVESDPGPFLRGLFHSDGCRANNWAQRRVDGKLERRYYPRWQFTNTSTDIRELCCWALDLAAIEWRQSNWKTISVNRREDVARLDALIGLKS